MDAAIGELTRAAQLAPQSALVQLTLGKALVLAGGDQEATPILERAVALNGNSSDAKYQLALAYQGTGRTKEALPLFFEAEKADPENAEVETNLAFDMGTAGQRKRCDTDLPARLERSLPALLWCTKTSVLLVFKRVISRMPYMNSQLGSS